MGTRQSQTAVSTSTAPAPVCTCSRSCTISSRHSACSGPFTGPPAGRDLGLSPSSFGDTGHGAAGGRGAEPGGRAPNAEVLPARAREGILLLAFLNCCLKNVLLASNAACSPCKFSLPVQHPGGHVPLWWAPKRIAKTLGSPAGSAVRPAGWGPGSEKLFVRDFIRLGTSGLPEKKSLPNAQRSSEGLFGRSSDAAGSWG